MVPEGDWFCPGCVAKKVDADREALVTASLAAAATSASASQPPTARQPQAVGGCDTKPRQAKLGETAKVTALATTTMAMARDGEVGAGVGLAKGKRARPTDLDGGGGGGGRGDVGGGGSGAAPKRYRAILEERGGGDGGVGCGDGGGGGDGVSGRNVGGGGGGSIAPTRGLERVPIQLGTARVSAGVLKAWPMIAGKSAAIDLLPPPPPPLPPPPIPRQAAAAAPPTRPVATRPIAPRPVAAAARLVAAGPVANSVAAKPAVASPAAARPVTARTIMVKREAIPTASPRALSNSRGRENGASEDPERRAAKSARALPPAPQTASDRACGAGGRVESAATVPLPSGSSSISGVSRAGASVAVGALLAGKVKLESGERINVAGMSLPEEHRPCSHRNRSEDKPCDRCHRARPTGAKLAARVVAPVTTTSAGVAAAAAVAMAPRPVLSAAVPPLAEADKVGTRETKALTPPERDEPKSDDETESDLDSGEDSDDADVGGDDVDVGGNPNANADADADANTKAYDEAGVSDGDDGGGNGDSDEPASHWACRSCATFNESSLLFCRSCATPFEAKGGQDGNADWWCCDKCSRFNNHYQDGAKCRLCSAPKGEGGSRVGQEQEDEDEDDGLRDNDEEEEEEEEDRMEEEEEEVISVGGGSELMSSAMTMATGSVERLALPLPPA